MECKTFEKKIPDFLNKKMDYPTLKSFHEHMDHCESCKEELSIQFLVMDGLQRLEDGDAFDLQKELDSHMEESRRKVVRNDNLLKAGRWVELVSVGILLGIVLWFLI